MASSVDESTKNRSITMFRWEIECTLPTNANQGMTTRRVASPTYHQSSNFFIPSESNSEYYMKLWPSLTILNSQEVFLSLVRKVRSGPTYVNTKRLRCVFFIQCAASRGTYIQSDDLPTVASGNVTFDISQKNLGAELDFILCKKKHADAIRESIRQCDYYDYYSNETKLIIFCVLQLESQEQNSIAVTPGQGNVGAPMSSLLSDFDKLMNEEEPFGDVIIVADNKKLVAYKGILAARSPVFAAMFRSPMKENKENQVVIDDIEYEVVKEMLRYIHTDQAPNLSKMATKLFVAADKYQLLRLKTMCELHACSNLATETVALDLLSAVLHDGKKLKTSAIEYIKRNKQAVAETKHWKDVMTNHPALLGQIILDFI